MKHEKKSRKERKFWSWSSQFSLREDAVTRHCFKRIVPGGLYSRNTSVYDHLTILVHLTWPCFSQTEYRTSKSCDIIIYSFFLNIWWLPGRFSLYLALPFISGGLCLNPQSVLGVFEFQTLPGPNFKASQKPYKSKTTCFFKQLYEIGPRFTDPWLHDS